MAKKLVIADDLAGWNRTSRFARLSGITRNNVLIDKPLLFLRQLFSNATHLLKF